MPDTRWFFDMLYLRGHPPWDTEVTPPEVTEVIEGGSLVPGRALTLGCGTGTNCVYLARHGWRSAGVDFALLAIWRARRRARREGVDCRFFRSDVRHMPFLAEPFDLVLDIGCLHSVAPGYRASYAAEVVRLSRPGALYMLYSFLPANGTASRGVTPQDVCRVFAPSFSVERQETGNDSTGPGSAWYWMRRSEVVPNGEEWGS